MEEGNVGEGIQESGVVRAARQAAQDLEDLAWVIVALMKAGNAEFVYCFFIQRFFKNHRSLVSNTAIERQIAEGSRKQMSLHTLARPCCSLADE